MVSGFALTNSGHLWHLAKSGPLLLEYVQIWGTSPKYKTISISIKCIICIILIYLKYFFTY